VKPAVLSTCKGAARECRKHRDRRWEPWKSMWPAYNEASLGLLYAIASG